jgi:hypothetical protein
VPDDDLVHDGNQRQVRQEPDVVAELVGEPRLGDVLRSQTGAAERGAVDLPDDGMVGGLFAAHSHDGQSAANTGTV